MTSPLVSRVQSALAHCDVLVLEGRVVRCTSLIVEAVLPGVAVGTPCQIRLTSGDSVSASVVGFSGPRALLMPHGDTQGIGEGCVVIPHTGGAELPVGDALLGRVVDSAMNPVDGGPAMELKGRAQIDANPPIAMQRRRIDRPLHLGVKAIDALLTMGEGQRVGVMAGPGVGKSVLLGMVARHCKADIIIVGMVGERGREVREFIERDLGSEGLARSVVVVATSDEPPVVRLRAAMAATALAEHYRRRGKKVMLLLDSLTRVAMAQREIGLAAGEPPTSKGYPPSVFSLLPRLLERAGNDEGKGSITGLYTVLAEGDDLTDPVVDCARSVLDGHIVLSRRLAGSGHFPAIDVLGSVSRVMTDILPSPDLQLANQARDVLATYRESSDLIEVGAYVAGSNPRVDKALTCIPGLNTFLRQTPGEAPAREETLRQLRKALNIKEAPRG